MSTPFNVIDDDEAFIIDPVSRSITSTQQGLLLVQYDHNSERYTFKMPRIIEGHDMSQCNVVQVHYENHNPGGTSKSNDVYTVDDLQVSPNSDDLVTFSWLIRNTATQIVGPLEFSICFQRVAEDGTVEYAWHTGTCADVSVIKTTHCTDVISSGSSDLVTSVLTMFGGLSFKLITIEEYNALESPNASMIYYVVDKKGNITQYIGATKLLSGTTSAGEAIALADGIAEAAFGVATGITESEESI